MQLRSLLLLCLTFCMLAVNAQEARRYVHPEYKIRYRDTVGTYIQVQSYFDRSYYTNEIYFRIKKGEDYYGEILSPDSNGLCKVVRTIDKNADLRINKCFEIKGITLKENKINRIEIREERGTLSLIITDVVRFDTASIEVLVIKQQKNNNGDTTRGTLPYAQLFPTGSYEVLVKTIPEYRFKYYAQPAAIKQKNINEPVFFDIKNEGEIAEIKMEAAYFPYKKFYPCYAKLFDGTFDQIKITPKRLYKVHYRKKGKRRFKKYTFYAKPNLFQNRYLK